VWDGDKGENVDIYVKSLNSDSPLRVTTNPALDLFPAWSPDGQKLAFVRIVPSVKITVFMTSALGTSSERLLIDLKTAPDSLSWSPDGKLIATSDSPSSQRAILLFSPETGERRYVTSPPPLYAGDANPVFSPDGKKIAFIRNNNPITGDIYVVPITGGEPRRVTSDNAEFFFGNGIVGGLAWTTDSQELVFSSSRGGIPALWRVALSGGEPERLAVGGDDTYYPSISSKGDRLTYTKRSGGTTVYQVDIRNVGPVTKLFSSSQADENVEYSPDGKKIAFNSYRSGTSEIWICDNDGTHLTQLTSFGKGKAGTPRWSPDGRFVAFDYRAVDTSNVYVANIAGGAPNCITTETKDDSVPSWSSDGNFIYLQSDRGGDLQIWRVPVAGGPGVQVTRHGGLYSFESQDGRYLYYNNPTYSTATRSSGVWRVPVAGGEEELVLDKGNAGTWGHWTISGENIYFISVASDGSLFLNALDMVTRRITQLTTLAQPLSEITSIDVSPDQRSLIFTQQNPISSDIMLVENFR
jgi:Tol biopolymer transport system component